MCCNFITTLFAYVHIFSSSPDGKLGKIPCAVSMWYSISVLPDLNTIN